MVRVISRQNKRQNIKCAFFIWLFIPVEDEAHPPPSLFNATSQAFLAAIAPHPLSRASQGPTFWQGPRSPFFARFSWSASETKQIRIPFWLSPLRQPFSN